MDNEPKVFVIICTYNSSATLEESINSVLNQSYKNIRLIIVNDGSTDNTDKVIEGLASKNEFDIHTIKKENSGLGDSRNKAIEFCRDQGAKYIAFCDADDTWTPNKLEMQMQVFFENPEADIVVTDMIAYDKSNQTDADITDLKYVHLQDIFETLCLTNFPFQPVTSVIRIELFEKIAIFTTDKSGQDFYPFLRFAFEGCRFYRVALRLYRERQLEGSLQRSPKSAFLGGRARTRAVRRVINELSDSPLMTNEKMSLLKIAHDRYCSWMLSGARKALPFKEQYALSVQNFPMFNDKRVALREAAKSVVYPLFQKSLR